MVALTNESIQAARQWYHDNALACIAAVKNGEYRVNDEARYFKDMEENAQEYLDGKWDHTLAFLQRAHFIQTGECVALLP